MITVTSKALDQVKRLLDQRGKNSKGIRIGIKTKGCSGLSYNLEYVDEPEKADEKIQIENVNIFKSKTYNINFIIMEL